MTSTISTLQNWKSIRQYQCFFAIG